MTEDTNCDSCTCCSHTGCYPGGDCPEDSAGDSICPCTSD